MTKEELCHELNCYLERQIGNYAIGDLDNIVDEFFNANVVIPKGENRHPYADVLHEWVEGMEVEFINPIDKQWAILPIDAFRQTLAEVRIKQKEPVYEWQWVSIDEDGKVDLLYGNKYFTQEEFDAIEWDELHYTFVKIEETKRER